MLRRRRHARSFDLSGLVLSALLGAAVTALLDPRRGPARRAWLMQKVSSFARRGRQEAGWRAKDLSQRAAGRRYEMRHAGESVPDDILVERVRAQVGKRTSHAGALEVQALGGTVVLSGPILRAEVHGVLEIVSKVRGVKGIDNRLEVHEEAGQSPGLQS